MNETEIIESVVNEYVRGTYEGNADVLKSVFHEEARMNGYLAGQKMLGTPAPFISDISSNPSTKSAGLPYETEITNVQVAGDVASVTLVEKGLMGLNFCNYLHLIKDDGKWLIISKVFTGSAQ